jgi:hypothetical protein
MEEARRFANWRYSNVPGIRKLSNEDETSNFLIIVAASIAHVRT